MKKTYLLCLSLFFALSLSAQSQCLDFSGYTNAYLDSVTMDDVLFPVGDAFISDGYIDLVKPGTGNFYQFIQGDTAIGYIGNIDIDVSGAPCTEKVLVFEAVYVVGMMVDGDTIFDALDPMPVFNGGDYTVEHNAGTYTITGDFDVVSLISSTNILSNICVECIDYGTYSNCVDFSNYDNAYLDDVTFDNTTYPIGEPFIVDGYIEIVKPGPGNYYQFIQGDTSMGYIGDIDIDVSSAPCDNKELHFSSVYLETLIVDGDTVFDFLNPQPLYNGNGFTVEYFATDDYVVSGDFDVVSLESSTNFIWDVCLECVPDEVYNDCVDFSNYDNAYLDDVTFDNTTYPIGEPFIVDGYIEIVKPGPGNYYQFIQGDTAMGYIGDVDIDVSSAPCDDKELHFSSVYLETLIVDGDTVFDFLNPQPLYTGNGFTVEYFATDDYVVSGDFDVVSLESSTNFIWDVCLECVPDDTFSECLSFDGYTSAYLDSVTQDDVNYPVGDPFIEDGFIQLVKPGTGNFYQYIQGDTSMVYIGDLDIDVSTAPCDEKVLHFSAIYVETLVVDGDTVFDFLNPQPWYSGNGFTVEYIALNEYIVSGDFDVVSLISSTNVIYDICLECQDAFTQIETPELATTFVVYPNPGNGEFFINYQGDETANYQIFNSAGTFVSNGILNGPLTKVDIREEPAGLYLVVLISENGQVMTKKLLVE